jgi:hypothetical protein
LAGWTGEEGRKGEEGEREIPSNSFPVNPVFLLSCLILYKRERKRTG